MKSWDNKTSKHIETPKEVLEFLSDIEKICAKHKFSIAHEDIGGNFIIENYNDKNIKWLKGFYLNLSP